MWGVSPRSWLISQSSLTCLPPYIMGSKQEIITIVKDGAMHSPILCSTPSPRFMTVFSIKCSLAASLALILYDHGEWFYFGKDYLPLTMCLTSVLTFPDEVSYSSNTPLGIILNHPKMQHIWKKSSSPVKILYRLVCSLFTSYQPSKVQVAHW